MNLSQPVTDTNIQITCQGECLLGAAVGDNTFVTKHVSNEEKWIDEVLHLSDIAKIHPHNNIMLHLFMVHGAIISGIILCIYYQLCRPLLFQPLEDAIHQHPSLVVPHASS